LEFDIAAFEDLAWWIQQDRNKALRIVNLIREFIVTLSPGLASQNL
jgi:Txe/YoeB family toxin of Txe-Axe toxin-antitoxin module